MAQTRWSIKTAQTDLAEPVADVENEGEQLPDDFASQVQIIILINYAAYTLIPNDPAFSKHVNNPLFWGLITTQRNRILEPLINKGARDALTPFLTSLVAGKKADPATPQADDAFGKNSPGDLQTLLSNLPGSSYNQVDVQGVIESLQDLPTQVSTLAMPYKANIINNTQFMTGIQVLEKQMNAPVQIPKRAAQVSVKGLWSMSRTNRSAQAGPLSSGRYESLSQLRDDLIAMGPSPETYEKFMSLVGPENEDSAKDALSSFFQGMAAALCVLYDMLISVGMANPIDAEIVEQLMAQHPELSHEKHNDAQHQQPAPQAPVQASLRKSANTITLNEGDYGTYILTNDDGRDILVQTDWDFPGTASTFGWQACPCGMTDGTVDCKHKKASQMIQEARAFLDEHIGDTAEDPGYFQEEAAAPGPVQAGGTMMTNASATGLFLPPEQQPTTKTAQRVYPAYINNGPGENKYCPKIRKSISCFVCRNHCLDGLVVDDGEVLCAEAIWRQVVADKFSREYRDAKGNWVGGYLNKRFEIHRDNGGHPALVAPGKRMNPIHEDAWSLEKRLAEMRQSESKKRGYNTPGDADQKDLYNFDQYSLLGGADNRNFEKRKDQIAKIASKVEVSDSMFKTAQGLNPFDTQLHPEDNPRAMDEARAEEELALEAETQEPESDDFKEPEEGDIITNDYSESPVQWYQYGKRYHFGTMATLNQKMEQDQFWPNVWFIDDHGGSHLISAEVAKAGQTPPPTAPAAPQVPSIASSEGWSIKTAKTEPPMQKEAWGLDMSNVGGGGDKSQAMGENFNPGPQGKRCKMCQKILGAGAKQCDNPKCRSMNVEDYTGTDMQASTGVISAPSISAMMDASVKVANGVYRASKDGMAAYGSTAAQALTKLAQMARERMMNKELAQDKPIDLGTESQELLDIRKEQGPKPAKPLPGGPVPAPVAGQQQETLPPPEVVVDKGTSGGVVPLDKTSPVPLEVGPSAEGARESAFFENVVDQTPPNEGHISGDRLSRELRDNAVRRPREARETEAEAIAAGAGPD